MAASLTEKQVPFTGPYGPVASGATAKGPTAEALKRAMGRLDFIAWNEFDQHFNKKLVAALDAWDPGGSGYDEARWTKIRAAKIPKGKQHAGQWALDAYAQKLIQDEAGSESDGEEFDSFAAAFVEFCNLCIDNEGKIHYEQNRPVGLEVDPVRGFVSDCSGIGLQAGFHAKQKTGLKLKDPSKQKWSGFGNTDLFQDDWPKITSPFRVGDAAHFTNSRHVIWCIKAGDVDTAEWISHGQESGPDRIRLATYSRYPREYLFTVRPEWL